MSLPPGLSFRRTRIAPTPSGFLHLGNIFSFCLTVGIARRTGASVLLRIDDLDTERVRDEYIQDIFDSLQFLDIPWDEGPADPADYKNNHTQLQRLALYQEALQTLTNTGELFACSCSRTLLTAADEKKGYPGTCHQKKLSLLETGFNWRLHTGNSEVRMHGLQASDDFLLPVSLKDPVVRKKDGLPSYQLASVCDDIHFGVDLVIRGADLRDSSLIQLYLSGKLSPNNFTDTRFIHHALLKENGEQKLSKSAGSTSVHFLRTQGKTAADIYRLIGERLGLPGEINSWQSLADGAIAANSWEH
jgi:glutamyl/glutaminyl-tRNA synthetase